MSERSIIWLPSVRNKLTKYQSYRFTPVETFDFISQFIMETERTLSNPIVGKRYTEESEYYKGISRLVIRKFKVYFEQNHEDIVIVAVLFPGEK